MKNSFIVLFLFFSLGGGLLAKSNWFLSPEIVKTKILKKDPNLVLLDAREKKEYKKLHIRNARSITWEELSQPNLPHKGNLLPTPQLVSILESLGISNNSLVLVYGDPFQGWGEEGRIAWTLRSLGHKETYIVDGGFSSLKELGVETSKNPPRNIPRGKFIHTPHNAYTADLKKVRSGLNDPNVIFIDTREKREFIGGVPYGEARGGHLPGAIHIHYRELLDSKGQVHSSRKITQILKKKGISKKATLINYCTGGIRSAWFTAVLASNGYKTLNYPGSMWEWSHLPEKDYPLVRGVK